MKQEPNTTCIYHSTRSVETDEGDDFVHEGPSSTFGFHSHDGRSWLWITLGVGVLFGLCLTAWFRPAADADQKESAPSPSKALFDVEAPPSALSPYASPVAEKPTGLAKPIGDAIGSSGDAIVTDIEF